MQTEPFACFFPHSEGAFYAIIQKQRTALIFFLFRNSIAF